MSLTPPNHDLQDDEMSDLATALSHSTSLQPYVESAPNSPPLTPSISNAPVPGPSCASLEKSATYRLRFLAEMSAMTNFRRARKRIEEMGEVEAFKLIRSSSSSQRLAAKKELSARMWQDVEDMERKASGRMVERVQQRTRKPRQSGPMAMETMSRREIIAMRRQKYFAKHCARAAENCAASSKVSGARNGRARGPMSGPMSADIMAENAVQRPLPSCPIRPVKDFNAPFGVTGPMCAEILVERSNKISTTDDEMEMVDLTESMNGTRL